VAAAALAHEQLLAVDLVGRTLLGLAAGEPGEQRGAHDEGEGPPQAAGDAGDGSSHARRNSIRHGRVKDPSRPSAASITPRATPSHDHRSRTVATSAERVRARTPPGAS